MDGIATDAGKVKSKLYVENLPILPPQMCEELFKHFGAIECVSLSNGKKWILSFEQTTSCEYALHYLNQITVRF
jgi:hypothetical protein